MPLGRQAARGIHPPEVPNGPNESVSAVTVAATVGFGMQLVDAFWVDAPSAQAG